MEKFKQNAHLEALLKYKFQYKLWYIILITALYATEIALTMMSQVKNYQTFQDRPRYEVFEPYGSNGLQHSYKTVAKKGSGKNCGDYNDSAHDMADFVNNFPSFFQYFFYIYLACLGICALVDVYKRVGPRLLNLCRTGGEYSGEPSPLSVTVMLLVLFYIPIYKASATAMNYPITSVRYSDCIHLGMNFTLSGGFYYGVIMMGFIITNGLVWIAMAIIMPGCWLKYLVLLIHLPGLMGAVFWAFVMCCQYLSEMGIYFFYLSVLWVLFYIIFSIFVVPFITMDYLLTPINLSVVIRFILVLCIDKGSAIVGLN